MSKSEESTKPVLVWDCDCLNGPCPVEEGEFEDEDDAEEISE